LSVQLDEMPVSSMNTSEYGAVFLFTHLPSVLMLCDDKSTDMSALSQMTVDQHSRLQTE
jgi:hypothetical protein